jgi:isocitrate dehydrogenase
MEAVLRILEAVKAPLAYEQIEIGKNVYERGCSTGIDDSAWESLRRTDAFLKAPITTPQGGGYKSLNVTVRKTLGLFANVRPCVAYAPYVHTHHPYMDLVIVRENEEDLYGGIEYSATPDTGQAIKLITRQGCERIARYAFEYARANGRRKVTAMSKDNIMKIGDGMFHQVFDKVAQDYPDIAAEHYIIDIGAARVATRPEDFDVIVTQNLYGDIISDIAVEVTGSVGLGVSANIGTNCAMFEAIHGSAPDIAGQDIANPSGLLLGAVQMLLHLGLGETATRVHNAWLRTIEDGLHTGDLYSPEHTRERVGTQGFADEVIKRLDTRPQHFAAVDYHAAANMMIPDAVQQDAPETELVGVDIFIRRDSDDVEELAEMVKANSVEGLSLHLIANRGTRIWPGYKPETKPCGLWRLRFLRDETDIDHNTVTQQLDTLTRAGLEFVQLHNLYSYDGKPGFSNVQGE